jgi:acetaldehyde dehydrogenase/alcohol dehydrogenase
VIKNLYAAEYPLFKYGALKTVGTIEDDPTTGIYRAAEPVGPIAAIVPCTNPTSTAIIKSLYAIKTRNSIVMLPHPRTRLCTGYAANLMAKYAEQAGAPHGCIQVAMPSREMSQHVMKHKDIKFILATGGPSMVNASYTSGKPSIGVGAGNAPALIDSTYDLRNALGDIVIGKTFDNGTICASEQSIIVLKEQYANAKTILEERGVHFVSGEDKAKLAAFFMPDGIHLNPEVVGKSAVHIASKAGISVSPETVALCVEATEIGASEVFSHEKLSPILALYNARCFEEGVDMARRLVENGGIGHTASLYSTNDTNIASFRAAVPAFHMIINAPSSLGAIGAKYTNLDPSLTLGVGTIGGSSSSGNVGPRELLNIKTVARKMQYPAYFSTPSVYSGRMCMGGALDDILLTLEADKKHVAVIVADPWALASESVDVVRKRLEAGGVRVFLFADFKGKPTFACIEKGVGMFRACKPDIVVVLGGGAAIDVAKVMRLHYEYPLLTQENMVSPFLEQRSRNIDVPVAHKLVRHFVAIPTTFAGAEMTPFAEIRMGKQTKVPVCSYALLPDTVIRDSRFIDSLPRRAAATSGFACLAQGIESYTSVLANKTTRNMSLDAIKTLHRHVVDAHYGQSEAREFVFEAAGQAAMAFGNTLLGVASAMAMRAGSRFDIPHGEALGIFLPHVVRFNASKKPLRAAAHPNYPRCMASEHYAEVADAIGVTKDCTTTEQKVHALVTALEITRDQLGLATSIQETGTVYEDEYMTSIDQLAEGAFGDQLGSSNPRYALMDEIRELFRKAWCNDA